MKILVTACNKLDNDKLLEPNIFLYHIDSSTEVITGIDVGLSANDQGITGLAKHDLGWSVIAQNDIKRALQHKPFRLIVLDNSLQMISTQPVTGIGDPHSIINTEQGCLIVSTATDSIIQLDHDGKEEQIWCISEEKIDSHHMNSLALHEGDIYISAFGRKQAELHSSATQGIIKAINSEKPIIEGIFHPHSLCISNSNFYFCSSGNGRVYENNTVIIEKPEGYLRGLALNENTMVVGVSKQRRKSKSKNRMAYNPAPEKIGLCEILIYNRTEKGPVFNKSISLEGMTDEIYDIAITEE